MEDKELVMELKEDISWLEQGCTTEKEICEHIKQAIKTIIQHKETENTWHTGTPTEEGWYLFSYRYLDTIRYGTDCFLDGKWVFSPALNEKMLKWQKINEGEE